MRTIWNTARGQSVPFLTDEWLFRTSTPAFSVFHRLSSLWKRSTTLLINYFFRALQFYRAIMTVQKPLSALASFMVNLQQNKQAVAAEICCDNAKTWKKCEQATNSTQTKKCRWEDPSKQLSSSRWGLMQGQAEPQHSALENAETPLSCARRSRGRLRAPA